MPEKNSLDCQDTMAPGQQQLEKTSYKGQHVRLCTDGKYRWTYPMDMLRNPTIFLTVCKIFAIIGGIAYVASYIGCVFRGEFALIVSQLKYWGIAVVVFLIISLMAYLIVASMYGWKYIVSFTMDEQGLSHRQIPAQKKNARKIGGALAGAGILSGSPGRVGQGVAVASHTQLSSDFARVKRIKAFPRRATIKVNEFFSKNQVYTTHDDFDFVLDYIRRHCPQAKA